MRYEDGVLKPKEPLPLSPGESAEVILVRYDERIRNLERFVATHQEELDWLTTAGMEEWVKMLEEEDRR